MFGAYIRTRTEASDLEGQLATNYNIYAFLDTTNGLALGFSNIYCKYVLSYLWLVGSTAYLQTQLTWCSMWELIAVEQRPPHRYLSSKL